MGKDKGGMVMPRSLWGLIVFGVKAAIMTIVVIITILAVVYACYGIGLLVNLVGKYFGYW